jgi:hypothetical protein
MEQIHHFSFRQQAELEEARGILHNIKHHALGARLQSIKDALPRFASARNNHRYPAIAMLESTETDSALSQSSASVFEAPLTPSSVVSEPLKKRARLHHQSGID